MSVSFNANNVLQAILGASSHPSKRTHLLQKVGKGLMENSALDPAALHKGIHDALANGVIAEEEVAIYFPGLELGPEPEPEPEPESEHGAELGPKTLQ